MSSYTVQLIAEWPDEAPECFRCHLPVQRDNALITSMGVYHRDTCRPTLDDFKMAEEFDRIVSGPRPPRRRLP